jgi:hypothetical protein
MDVQLPDGTLLQGIPDGTTKAQIATKLKSSGHAVPDDWLKPAAPAQPKEGASFLEHADIAASAISGGVASLAGGVVKAGGYANKALGLSDTDANEAAARLEDALTWKPKTDKGRAVMADVAKGMQAFEDWTDKQGSQATQAIAAAGTQAADVAKSLGAPQSVVDFIDRHKDQVAAAYGAATKTAINAVPLMAGDELAKLRGAREPDLAPGEVPKPAAAPGAPAAVPAPAAPPLTAAPPVPRGTPNTSLEAPLPPTSTPAPVNARARAQAYVRDRLGLSWDALGEATRTKLERVAADAQGLDRLNPEAVKRQAHLEALRVPVKTTAGRLTRDDAQLIKEEGVAGTNAGRPIREIDADANRDIRRNVEVLVDRLRGVGQSRAGALRGEKVGEVIAGRTPDSPGALTKLQQQAKARTKAAYEDARKTDPEAKVAADPMYEFVRGNPEVINPQIQHLAWLNNWLKKAGIEKVDEAGAPTGERRPIKAVELDDLRKKAGKMAGSTGDSAHYAKEVLGVIDQMFDEGLPASAGKWKAARETHAAERDEFKNQGAIDRLVGKKGGAFGTDPKTALEDVWKVSVKNAKIDEVRQLKRSLLSGQDAATRLQGKQALRTLRAATAQNLLDDITKGVSTNERGETNITADSINRWIKGIGNDGTVEGGVEKLQVVFGRKAARELMDIREAAQIAKTAPTTRVSGSNTFQNILNWMEDTGLGGLVKHIPGAGPAVHLAEKAVKAAEAPRIVRESGRDATSIGEKAGAKVQSRQLDELVRQRAAADAKRPRTYGDGN